MKKLTSLLLFVLVLFNCEAFALTLSKGTKIPVKAVKTISAQEVSVGQNVHFVTTKNIQDSFGNTIIKQDTPVVGSVVMVKPKRRIGKSAMLSLDNFTTKTTAGAQVPLNGNITIAPKNIMCRSIVLSVVIIPFFLLMHGKAAEIAAESEYVLSVK